MSEVALGTLYELNKSAMEKEKRMTNMALNKTLKEMEDFFSKGSYFMLLCHEQRDYTVFIINAVTEEAGDNAIQNLKECLINRGEVLSIDYAPGDQNAFEIWNRDDSGEPFCYYLFPYDSAVIEVK